MLHTESWQGGQKGFSQIVENIIIYYTLGEADVGACLSFCKTRNKLFQS